MSSPTPNNSKRYAPPARGAAPSQSATRAAPVSAPAPAKASAPRTSGRPSAQPKAEKKAAADYDIVAVDHEWENVEKVEKEVNGKTINASLRLGAIWKGRPRDDGSMGAPFVVLGLDPEVEGGGQRVSCKMFLDEELQDGSSYTLRLTERGPGGKRVAVKGQAGCLAKVWWPIGGSAQFSFTTVGTQLTGGRGFGLAFQRSNGRKN